MREGSDSNESRLDGNAAAGVLAEIFCVEASLAQTVCAGCGASGLVGELTAYALEMGAVLRCPHCDTAILRIGVTGNARWVDLRGAVSLRFAAAVS